MHYLVFAQTAAPQVDLAKLVENAGRYFSLSLNVLKELRLEGNGSGGTRLWFELFNPRRGYTARFQIAARERNDADLSLAREAEVRTQASGMALLAERCPSVWEVQPEPGTSQHALFELCAILAATALGPVMASDASGLFGVRGALERAAQCA